VAGEADVGLGRDAGLPVAPMWPPSAMRIWALTMSRPVTISVTVCSTWMRGFTSMK
jgi:hypothetical protein